MESKRRLKRCRAALDEAATRFDPNPFFSLILAFTQDRDIIEFVRSSGRYPKELEAPYPQTRRLVARLVERYKLGVIANQPGQVRLSGWSGTGWRVTLMCACRPAMWASASLTPRYSTSRWSRRAARPKTP